MPEQTIVCCPHCGAELAVPDNATQFLCWSCKGAVALAPTAQEQTATDEEWEIVDVPAERRTVRLLAGFSFLALGIGLRFAPGLPAWVWIATLASALCLAIAALASKRSRRGWGFLTLTVLVFSIALVHWRLAEYRRTKTLAALRMPTAEEEQKLNRLRGDIAGLVAKRQRALAEKTRTSDQLRIASPVLQWRSEGATRQAIARFVLVNRTEQAIKAVDGIATVTARNSAEPLLATSFRLVLRSLLSANEQIGILEPIPELDALATSEHGGRTDLVLAIEVVNALTFTDQLIATPFTADDRLQLAALEAELTGLERSIAQRGSAMQ